MSKLLLALFIFSLGCSSTGKKDPMQMLGKRSYTGGKMIDPVQAKDKPAFFSSPEKSCNKGDGMECVYLGFIEHKKGHIIQASKLYQKACDGKEMRGCYLLGFLEEERGDIAKAQGLYGKACGGKEMSGCFNLGGHRVPEGKYCQGPCSLYQGL